MDELTSVDSSSASDDTSLDGDSTSQPSSTPQQQSAEPSAPTDNRINLFESQEFRNYQAQMSRQMQAAQAAAAQAQQQLEEYRLSQMDDYDKAEYRAQRAEAMLQQYQQDYERQQLEMTRQQRLMDTAQRFNVPVENIQEAQTPFEMYEAALAYLASETKRTSAVREQAIRQRAEASDVDLGGSSYGDGGNQSRIDRAIRNKDSGAYFREVLGLGKRGY